MAEFMAEVTEPLVVSPYVVAELDYLTCRRMGRHAELLVLQELSSGSYEHPILGSADLARCLNVVGRFYDLGIGVTDASIVVLADRYQTTKVATFDRRHFSALRKEDGASFTLLP